MNKLPLAEVTITVIPKTGTPVNNETMDAALRAYEDLDVVQQVYELIKAMIDTREDLTGFRVTVTEGSR